MWPQFMLQTQSASEIAHNKSAGSRADVSVGLPNQHLVVLPPALLKSDLHILGRVPWRGKTCTACAFFQRQL